MASNIVERRAPVQGYSAGIPWSMHLRAYDVYCKKWSPQKALIEGGCRGGFGTEELDDFIPGWRDELSEITKLRAELAACRAEREGAVAALKKLCSAYVNLLEIGRDRIIGLGGTCDAVDVMEAGDPALRAARAALQPSEPDGPGIGDGS